LSARLDGEAEPVAAEVVDRHLSTCPECRSWFARAQAARRMMTVRAAPPVPDLTETILERIPAPTGLKWPARIALGLVAIAQLTLSVAQLLGVATGMGAMADTGSMAEHLTHESSAWNLAVGIGLLWAAMRTKAAAGQLPLLTGFVLVLTILSADDLVGHDVTAARLLSHGLVVVGLALLYVVYRQNRDDQRPKPVTGDALGVETRTTVDLSGADAAGEAEDEPRRHPWRRPASRHRAA
jgi:predicted anti-sigma-YlaC factor YlaD